jgi:hypothetical protein
MDENSTFEEVTDALWLRVRKQALRGWHTTSIARYQHRGFPVNSTVSCPSSGPRLNRPTTDITVNWSRRPERRLTEAEPQLHTAELSSV